MPQSNITCSTKNKRQSGSLSLEKKWKQKSWIVCSRHRGLEVETIKGGSQKSLGDKISRKRIEI